jgi:hypothetical protein
VSPTRPPRVYISYSWDSAEHKTQVLALSNRLRGDGIETHLDQYEVGPASGWKRWQEEQIERADFVALVCTPRYRQRLESGVGSGAHGDGQLMQRRLAGQPPGAAGARDDRSWLVPVGFGHYRENRESIPAFVGDVEYYNVAGEDGYRRLVARLRGEPFVMAPPVAGSPPEPRAATTAPATPAPPSRSAPGTGGRSSVFISYSHADRKWLDELRPYLRDLEREHPAFEFWDDSTIRPGDEWRPQIRRALEAARVAILLVSQPFLASEFIRNHELPSLLDAAKNDGVRLLMLLVSPSRFEHVDALSRFQALHSTRKTLADMKKAERQRLFVRLSEEIAATLRPPTPRQPRDG